MNDALNLSDSQNIKNLEQLIIFGFLLFLYFIVIDTFDINKIVLLYNAISFFKFCFNLSVAFQYSFIHSVYKLFFFSWVSILCLIIYILGKETLINVPCINNKIFCHLHKTFIPTRTTYTTLLL